MAEQGRDVEATASRQRSTAALLLLRGDPLPELRVTPAFQLDAFAGKWLLLLSCDPARVGSLASLEVPVPGDRAYVARALVRGVETAEAPHFADLDGHAADALGALAGPDGRADVAALLDPRGRVHWSGVS